ncbi:MAG: sulfatase-like hydrolase/transferase, partial [Myxococcota bacterium]
FSDLAGAFIAIGFLFDAKWETFVLLAIAAVMAMGLGAAVTAALSILWWPRVDGSSSRVRSALAGIAVVVAVLGYFARAGRQHVPEPASLAPQTLERTPPILWIVIDTLRADTFYGEALDFPLAPETGAFADDSLVFSNAESTAGWTIPSLAALLTGIHNTTTDASAGFLPDWAPSIASRLSVAGYSTHALVDNVIIEPRNGFGAGFDTFFQRSGYRFAFSLPTFRLLPTALRESIRGVLRTSYLGSRGLTDQAIRVIESAETPPFVFVHYMDPHAPYHLHPELGEFAEENDEDAVNYYYFRDILRADEPKVPTDGQVAWLKHRYENEVRALDRDLGRLFRAWTERFGDTGMVLLTADHGEEFMDHGHLGHGITLNREMVHVPLILRLPADLSSEGRTIETPVSLVDVVQTTADLIDLDLTLDDGVRVQGTSWLPWLQGDATPVTRPLVSGHSRNGRRVQRVREGHWAYILNMFYDDRPRFVELYDLDADPREQNDLSQALGAKRAEMEKKLGRLIRALIELRDDD